jgi:hypothetical protein
MSPKEAAEYMERCKDWFTTHPVAETSVTAAKAVIDTEVVAALFSGRDSRPGVEEHVAVLQKAGYPEAVIERVRAHAAWLDDTYDARTKQLDLIFAKWPAASKSVPKLKKVIKAVRKKL